MRSKITRRHKSLARRSVDNFQTAVGGRDEFLETIECLDDEMASRLIRFFESAGEERTSLRRACERLGLTVRDLHALYVNALKARAAVEVTRLQAQHLPRVVEDTLKDAMTVEKMCPDCWGEGTVYRRRRLVACATCEGTGKVLVPGSVANRKLLFESAGLIKQGPALQQTFHFDKAVLLGGGGPPLETIVKNTNKLLREAGEK